MPPRPWVNLGCGSVAPEGWTNIDRSPGIVIAKIPGLRPLLRSLRLLGGPQADVRWPSNVRRHDVRRGLPFATGTVGVIYSSHMLEHLANSDARGLIAECRRVLRHDGLLRLALPDLRKMAMQYIQSVDDSAADMFVRASGMGFEDRTRGPKRAVELLSGARHKWMYDAASVQVILRDLEFPQTRVCSFRQGRCPALEEVEHRQDSFFVEAYVSIS
jgi:SAM-dependent methyltransferase